MQKDDYDDLKKSLEEEIKKSSKNLDPSTNDKIAN